MALIDHHKIIKQSKKGHKTTKHPIVCLVCSVAFLVTIAFAVHIIFNALV